MLRPTRAGGNAGMEEGGGAGRSRLGTGEGGRRGWTHIQGGYETRKLQSGTLRYFFLLHAERSEGQRHNRMMKF